MKKFQLVIGRARKASKKSMSKYLKKRAQIVSAKAKVDLRKVLESTNQILFLSRLQRALE